MIWNMGKTTNGNEVAESTWTRAKQRLAKTTPQQISDNTWLLAGNPKFGDAYDEYSLTTDGKGTWYCLCHNHYGGEFRRRHVCSHSAAVALYTGLPCERTLPVNPLVNGSPNLEKTMQTPEKPCEIPGVPERYTTWRPYQRETVEWVLEQFDADTSIVSLDAPTGCGKSLVAVAASKLADLKSLYCVSTLQLQQQLANDFPGAIHIWGRQHYRCVRFSGNSRFSENEENGLTATDCTHTRRAPCPKLNACPYRRQKAKALQARLAVVNYSFFLTEANNVGGFSGWPLAIFDEGDTCESELMKYVSTTITAAQLERCAISPPEYKTKLEAWLQWVKPARRNVASEVRQLEDQVKACIEVEKEPPLPLMHDLLNYTRLLSKLKKFESWVDETWILDMRENRWEFKPTFVKKQGEMLWGHASKHIVMSATLLSGRDWARDLGLSE